MTVGNQLWLTAVVVGAVPVGVYFAFALGRTEWAGPLFEGYVREILAGRLWAKHGFAAETAAISGYMTVVRSLEVLGLFTVVAVAAIVGYLWRNLRLGGLAMENAGPDPSTPEEKLFPSDHGARMFRSGSVPPLPAWLDLLTLVLCATLGAAVGLLVTRGA